MYKNAAANPPAEELEVIGELVPGPPLLALAVAVLHDGGVLHEGDVPAPLHQAPEGARVSVIVFHCRPGVPVYIHFVDATHEWWKAWLNMELYLQSLFGFYVHNCTHWLRPRNPPPPSPLRIWAQMRGRYWTAKIDDISL
jgi:hypothetical protein